MKKKIAVLLLCMAVICLAACGEKISKYKSDESDNFFTETHTEGGSREVDGAYLEKISFNRLLGPEKLIFTVKNQDKDVDEMPYFTIDVTQDNKLISGVIYGCTASDAQNYARAAGNCVESYEVTESEGNIIFTIRLKDNVRTSIYDNEAEKLVFSFKMIYPVQK